MDRNTATGLILMSLLLIIYFQFFSPTPVPQEEIDQPIVSETIPQTSTEPKELTISPSNEQADNTDIELQEKFGMFASGAVGNEEKVEIETNDVVFSFSSKGASINKVQLKDFLTYYKKPLVLLDEGSSKTSITLVGVSQIIDLSELYYDVKKSHSNDTTLLTFTLNLDGNGKIIHSYSIPDEGFLIGYSLELEGLDAFLQTDPVFSWQNRMKNLEHDIESSRIRATINYHTANDGFDGFSESSTDFDEETLGATNWVAYKQQFFTSAIIAINRFSTSQLSLGIDESDTSTVKVGSALLKIPAADFKEGPASFTYFFGPNNYQILKKVAIKFDKNIYLGWPPVNFVNKYLIIPIFNFLENYIGNYGIIIIILVLIIKIVLSPLSYKSYLSMAKTKVLKPELDEMKKKYPDDQQKQQKEQMKLYQQVGVNPLSGCIPMVLQMPILFAMFYFFPSSIELRQQSFLWADDLSTYDSIYDLPFTIPLYGDHVSLFVLLMTASTILYTWSNNQVSSMQGPMKSISYMMPVIFMFVLNSFPAALSFYYFIANLITFGQQAIIRKFVDEDKILAILNENRLKNKDKKKSKFQMKIEQAMKAGEESQKSRKKK